MAIVLRKDNNNKNDSSIRSYVHLTFVYVFFVVLSEPNERKLIATMACSPHFTELSKIAPIVRMLTPLYAE